MKQSIVAVFPDRELAIQAMRELEANGLPHDDISIRAQDDIRGTTAPSARAHATEQKRGGFLNWLFGSDEAYDVPAADERALYRGVHEQGKTILVVTTHDSENEYERINHLIDRFEPVSITETDDSSAPASEAASGESVLPLVEEKMKVGKRQVRRANAYKVRTVLEEVPVEDTVTLKDEKVVVETRPASGSAGTDAFRERTVEVDEIHEEPVVEKTPEQTGEVVIRKEAKEHVETVRDKVRRTRVEQDKGSRH